MIFEWLYLLSSLASATSEMVNVTAHGHTFLLAFPKLADSRISIIAYTIEDMGFMVKLSLTVPGSNEHNNIGEMTVAQREVSEYILTGDNIPTSVSDYRHHNCLLMSAEWTFGVQVQMYSVNQSQAGFLALPVNVWGKKYIIVTLHENPFFIVVSTTKTKLTISLLTAPVVKVLVNGTSRAMGGNRKRTLTLDSFQAFSLSKCMSTDYKVSFTGSRIESYHPVGVISGSCNAYNVKNGNCSETTEELNTDHAAEMMFPEKLLGLEFLVAFDWGRRMFNDYTVIASAFMETNVTTHYTPIQTYFLGAVGSVLEIPASHGLETRHLFVRSNKPISVFLAFVSSCDQKAVGGPSLLTVVPNELYHNSYVIVYPLAHDMIHHLIVIGFSSDDLKTILVNNRYFIREISLIRYMEGHITGTSQIISHSRVVVEKLEKMLIAGPVRFGCYYVGILGNYSSYVPGGFVYEEEKLPDCVESEVSSGDLIDNDCDKLTDEESINNIDDDGDGKVDEDTFNTSSCNAKGKWGKDCLLSCSEYCLGDCNKENGICLHCIPGRMEPQFFCFRECPAFTFGQNCSGDCKQKCRQIDCMDRVDGECPPEPPVKKTEESSYFWYWILLILLLAIAGLLTFFYLNKSPPEETPLEVAPEKNTEEKKEEKEEQVKYVMMDEYALWLKRRRSGSDTDKPDQYNITYILNTSIFKDGKYYARPQSRGWPAFFSRSTSEPAKKTAVKSFADKLDNLNVQTITQSLENLNAGQQVVNALEKVETSLMGPSAPKAVTLSDQKPPPVPKPGTRESSSSSD